MTDKTTPAFPVHGQHIATGLTIRDYFAAKAMQVCMTTEGCGADEVARMSYTMADAMLRARDGVK